MKSIIVLAITFISHLTFGQSLESYLQTVERKNARLITLQKWLDAEEIKAKTGIYPDNPEISYSYLFGNSAAIGDQEEIEIIQAFKLPGYYISKSATQKLEFQQKQALAEKQRREILNLAEIGYFKLVWLNKKKGLLNSHANDAKKLVELMKAGFEIGEISKPAYDKVRIHALNIQTESQKVQSEIQVQIEHLQQLNGGISIEGTSFNYPLDWELPVLDSLLANLAYENPALLMAHIEIKQSEKEIKHARMNSMPSLEAGYKAETILNQKLQGFHAGISIPLWEKKNSVRYAKLNSEMARANYTHEKSILKAKVSTLYFEAKALKDSYLKMKQLLNEEQLSGSSLELLQSGQISFYEYFMDISLIMETQLAYLQTENAYFTLISKLKAF